MTARLTAHLYEPDRDAPPDHLDRLPCRRCPLPAGNRVHDETAVAQIDAAQAEHLRRIGEDQN